MILSRRKFILGAAAVVATPAVIRIPGLIMPVKAVVSPQQYWGVININNNDRFEVYEWVKYITKSNHTNTIRTHEPKLTFSSYPFKIEGSDG